MAESVVTVSWEDHTSELVTEFKSLLDNNSFVDCTISAEGQSLQAHRLVLSACSPYFHKLFCEETEDHPLVMLLDESFQNLKAVIDFIYCGVTQIPEGNYRAFVTLAKSLEVKGLSQVSDNPPASTIASQDPSVKNQVTGEVKGSNATRKVSTENKNCQKIAHHLNSNTNPVDTHSPASFKGNSALRELRPKSVMKPSQEQESLQGALYLQVQPGLYAAISGASNQLVVKSDESLSRNFTSQMGCGTASVQGQVFLISGAGSLPPVGLQAAQQLNSGPQQNSMILLREGPFLSSMAHTPTSNLAGHKLKQKKRLTCKICGVSCNAQANLIIHERTQTGERPYLCDVCGATFSTSGILTCHIRTHTGERPYECDFCCKTFRQKSNLNLHLPLHTGKYPHRCDVCGKTFLQNQEFIEHKNLHTGERPNRCDVCGIAFRRAQNLRVHKLRHTGKWPYRCDVCGKTFSQKNRLTQHMPLHTGERPYSCDICGKAYGFKQSLITHRKIHTGERPHCCDVCGKTFRQKTTLVAHSRVHTGERPFCCELCGARFHQQGGLMNHMRTHNKIEPS